MLNSGFPSTRINLSPFTKAFRGGEQLNESINNFSSPCLSAGPLIKQLLVGKNHEAFAKKKRFMWVHEYLAVRELTNRRLLHDDAVGSRHSPESPSCRNLNLRFTVKTTTLVRARQIFPPFLKLSLFVF